MHVIATAGHVDHGKSTLVTRLTGSDPDRLEEEQRRGLSIELGYAWTHLPPVGDVAFVDVPGHERFVSTMLSGVGPVPAVLFVIAADDPWMPQAEEHLAVIDALGISHGLLAVTRADLADPKLAMKQALERIRATSLGDVPVVAVSGRTGLGIDELREALTALASRLPTQDAAAEVRLWVDRSFHVRGAGTVVTGTLPAGTITVGDTLELDGNELRVRALECLGKVVGSASGVCRVAVNVSASGGRMPVGIGRGSVLLTPGMWSPTSVVDVRVLSAGRPPREPLLHVGAASVSVRTRPLDGSTIRLLLPRSLPLRFGDRMVLRDPGSRRVWGLRVLDADVPSVSRRGAAARRAKELASADGSLVEELRRRGVARGLKLRQLGIPTDTRPVGVLTCDDDWLISEDLARQLRIRMQGLLHERQEGMPLGAMERALDLPSSAIVRALIQSPVWESAGRLFTGYPKHDPKRLAALKALRSQLERDPFSPPTAKGLQEIGLDRHALKALADTGHLLRVAETIALLPGSDLVAAKLLRGLQQPFTTSEARVALGTSRRVALALLAHMDRHELTIRLHDDRRRVLDTPDPQW